MVSTTQQQGRKRKEEASREEAGTFPLKSSNDNSNAAASPSKALPPPTTPDAAFPRGGQAVHRRPGRDRISKRDAAMMEADNGDALDFVKPSAAAAASRRGGMSSAPATPSSTAPAAFVAPLRRSNLVPGSRLLGVVTSVTAQKVEVALPTGLRGSADRLAAAALPTTKSSSPPLSALYRVGQVVRCAVAGKKEKMSALEGQGGDTSSDDEGRDEEGGESDDDGAAGGARESKSSAGGKTSPKTHKKRAVLLTMAPAAVSGSLPRSALFSGNPVLGWIASEEDHGFVVDLGSPGVTGFLPRADAPDLGAPSPSSPPSASTLPPTFSRGAQLDLVVASDGPSAGADVVRLKAAPRVGAGPPSREPPAADASALRALPLGALVSATVTSSSSDPGAGVHLKFWSYLTGAADAFALPTLAEGSAFATRFAVGTKHRARVVFVDSGNAKSVRLSLLPHVVSRSSPSPGLPAVGALIKDGVVKRVDEGLGVLVEFPNYRQGEGAGGDAAAAATSTAAAAAAPPPSTGGGHPVTQSLLGYTHISNACDGRVASLSKLFKPGDKVAAARAVGARPADALAALSLAPAATAAGTLGSAAELKVGETVKGVVEAAHASRGLLVSLAPGVRARVPIEHLVTGEPGGASALAAVARRPVGARVTARVFAVSRGDGADSISSTRATLTLRKPLVAPGGDPSAAPKLPPILSVAEAKPGLKAHGVVTGPAPGGWHRGVFVSLYGGLTGVVSGGAELGLGPRVAAALAAAAAAAAAASAASSTPAAAAATAAAAAEVASALPRGTLVKARVLSAAAATGKVRLSLLAGAAQGGSDDDEGGDAAAASAAAAAEDAAAGAALTERLSGGYAPGELFSDSEVLRVVAVEREEKKKRGGEEDDDDDDGDDAPPSAFIVELPPLEDEKKKKKKKKKGASGGPLARILRCHLSDSPKAAAALASSLGVGSALPGRLMVLDVRAVGRAAAAAAAAALAAAEESGAARSSLSDLLLLPITVSLTRKASMVRAASSLPRSNGPDALSSLAEGQALRGFVASLTPDSAFVRFLGRATGRAPLPRAGSSAAALSLSVGDSVSAVITAVDAPAGRFSLSLKGRAGDKGGGEAARALGDLFADLAAAAAARAEAENNADEASPSPCAAWPSPGSVVEVHPSEAKPYGLLLDLEEFPDAAALAPAPRHHFDGGEKGSSGGVGGGAAADKRGGKKKSKKGGGDGASAATPPEPSMPAARTLRARVLDVSAADGVVDVSLRSELLAGEGDDEDDEKSSSLPAVGASVSAVVELSRPDYLVLSLSPSSCSSSSSSSKKKKEKKTGAMRAIGFAPALSSVPLVLGSAVEGLEVAEHPSAANGGRLILKLPAFLAKNAAAEEEEEAAEEKAKRNSQQKQRQSPEERAAARASARAAEAALAAEAVHPGTLVSAVVVAIDPLHAEVRLSGAGPCAGRQGRVHATEARDDGDDGGDEEQKRGKKRARKASPPSSSKPLPLPFAGLNPGDEIKAVVLGAAATPGGRAHGVLELSTRASLVAAAAKGEEEGKEGAEGTASDGGGGGEQNRSRHLHHHPLPRASLRPRVVASSLGPGTKVRGFVQEVKADGAWIALTPTARARLRALDAAADLDALSAFAESASLASAAATPPSTNFLSVGSPVDATVLRVVRRSDGGGIDVDLTTLPVSKAAAREAAAGDLVLGLVKSLPTAAAASGGGNNRGPAALGDGCVRVSFSPSPHAPLAVGRVSLCDLRDELSADALAGIKVGTAVRCRVLEAAAAGGGGNREARLSLRLSDGGAIAAASSSSSSSSSPPLPLPASLRLPEPLSADAGPSSLKVGDRVAGYVAAVGRPGAFVALSRGLDGRVPLRDLAAGFVPEPAAAFPPGALVVGRVAALVPGGKVQLTLRGGVVPGSEGEQEEGAAGGPLGAVAALLLGGGGGGAEASAPSSSPIRVGAVVAGRVRRVEAFGVFVDLDVSSSSSVPSASSSLLPLRAGLAHVSELADEFVPDPGARFRPGQHVTARVLKVDAATGRVSLSLRPSAVRGEPRPAAAGREERMEGSGEEEEEESDIDDRVAYDDDDDEEEGDEEGAEMELDGGARHGSDESEEDNPDACDASDASDSPSAGLDSDDDDDGDDDEDLNALRLSAGGISRDNSAEAEQEEDEEDSDDADGGGGDETCDDESRSDLDLGGSDEDSDVDARLGAAAAGGGRAARSPAPSRRVSSSPAAPGGLGGLDVGLPVGWGEDDDDGGGGGEDERAPTTPAPGTPAAASPALSKASKRRAERAAAAASEAATDAAERVVASRAAPADEASFRRALAASPNSSFLWIRYVAHLLSLGEVDRARAALAAALETIALEATADRFNVWVAALNLEASHGSASSASSASSSSSSEADRAAATLALFRKAARHTDAKKLNLALVPILERAGLGAAAVASAAAAATKAFPTSCKVWLARHAAALRAGDAAAAAAALRAATVGGHDGKGALPPRKHVKFLSRAAVAEFKNSSCSTGEKEGVAAGGGGCSAERGRELFEKLLAAAPKRLDLWAQYIDQEVSLALAGTGTGKKRKRDGNGEGKKKAAVAAAKPDPRRVRALFARGTALDLPPKKMKFLFRRALEFEKRLGDDAGADKVREAARAYVAKVSGGAGGGV